jgi:hypothetical protein
LTIQTKGNQSIFRIGEVIPLELAFTSTRPGYQLDMATYDRSGRLDEETFNIDPAAGWDDPLAIYYQSYRVFIGGGLRGSEVLSTHPTIIFLELNEWIRFKYPGRYRMRIVSHRVSKQPAAQQSTGLIVTSNELTLTVVPATREWQESTLKAAVGLLNSPKTVKAPNLDQTDPNKLAIKTLRYLGTASAARELARRLTGSGSDWEFSAGLLGSPDKEAALAEMKKLLVDPNFPVTGRFLETMSVLALPEDIVENLPAEREKAETEFRQELIAGIGEKQGGAAAVSNNTIIADAASHSRALPADLKRAVTRQLLETFDSLPIEKQAELLQFRWSALDHQEMLPLLRKVAKRYQDFKQLREMNAYQFNNASAAAITHWYDVAPDEARPFIIQEVLRPKPRFNASVLGILTDQELPEADESLVEHLIASQGFDVQSNIASLIYRYATPAIEPRVTIFLDQVLGKVACAVQEPLLAYLLKVDAKSARPRLESAMAARGEGFSACNHSLLQEVAKLHNDDMLQEMAAKGLDDPDPQIVDSASTYLMEFGSPSVEDILWSRFTAWSEQWKGKESELQFEPSLIPVGQYQANAGSKLMQALAAGHSWLADETKLRRLVALSVTQQQRQQALQYISIWKQRPWSIQFIPIDGGQFRIAQYQEHSIRTAEEKLLQFSRGSTFQWFGAGGQEGEDKTFQELSKFAAEHGLKLAAVNP